MANRVFQTTKGWKFLVQWKVGESKWVPLKDLKKSNPIELAEYVLSKKLEEGGLKMLFENEITLMVKLSLATERLLTSLVFDFHIVSKKR